MFYQLSRWPMYFDSDKFGIFLNVRTKEALNAGVFFVFEFSLIVFNFAIDHDFKLRKRKVGGQKQEAWQSWVDRELKGGASLLMGIERVGRIVFDPSVLENEGD